MPIAWYPNRWCSFCMSEDEKKEIELFFYRVLFLMYATWEYCKNLTKKIIHEELTQFFLSDFLRHFVAKNLLKYI